MLFTSMGGDRRHIDKYLKTWVNNSKTLELDTTTGNVGFFRN